MGFFVSSLNLIPIDIRINRDAGFLINSRLINFNDDKHDITNLAINDLIEKKGIHHFCFIVTDCDGYFQMDSKPTKKNQKDLPPNIDELSG